eukprot:scaffold65245_cov72-Phaeocystis_antarctica.AAC.3
MISRLSLSVADAVKTRCRGAYIRHEHGHAARSSRRHKRHRLIKHNKAHNTLTHFRQINVTFAFETSVHGPRLTHLRALQPTARHGR